ncbi:hypothetical protein CPB85DRAFT_1562773 [Mucidula mucida]|nr:hypothetical protein CPB85DRAFT_1562773 [Mucidula mucida]
MPALPVGHLAGYYMDFATTRALMEFYEIPDKGVQDKHLDHPLNDWLAEKRKYTVLAGTIRHPSKGSDIVDGMLLVTQQVWYKNTTKRRAASLPPPAERDIDVRVKQWLISGGATEDKLEWLSILETYAVGLTRYGYRPTSNDVQGQPELTLDTRKLPDEAKPLVGDWVTQGMPDARTFFGDELYELMTADSSSS